MEILASSLRGELGKRHVVLHMDTHTGHTHESVLKACSDFGIYVHFVPASTTSWLQPLDVLVFARFKQWVTGEAERRRMASVSGTLTRPEVLHIWLSGVDQVIRSQGWCRAFDMCGLRSQGNLSARLSARLGFSSPPLVGCDLPSLEDLQAVFPSGMDIPVEPLFRLFMVKAAPVPPVLVLHPRARLPGWGCT